jgi:lysophospholipid acyltransferase (LPLAT)-like uncharacterized protein
MSRLLHLKLWITATLGLLVWRLLNATYRVEIVDGASHVDDLLAAKRPVVFVFWHDSELFFFHFLYRHFLRAGFPLSVLSSHSRDGELGAKIGRMLGVHIVRGSSSRGGTQGLRALYRAVLRGGYSPIVTPDGPRGPAHRFKAGGVVLAQLARVPIVPLACDAERVWRLGSWDRMVLPKPWSRVRVMVGAPEPVSPDAVGEVLERERERLEGVLQSLARRVSEQAAAKGRNHVV